MCPLLGLGVRKPVFGGWEQQRRRPAWADAHCMISSFNIHLLKNITSRLASSEISISIF